MRKPSRIGSRLIALLVVAAMLCPPAGANENGQLSPSVVLVLKLVATNRVQPATGVVISNDGLVLIPSEFVTGAEEIIVLDGGTDIARNGRPGTVKARSPDTGLSVLSVDGLKRPGIKLSRIDNLYADGTHFQAFPPAHLIAAGAPPLKVPMQAGESLPYLTGAILDGCGYLSGMTLAIGLQKPVPGHAPLIFDGSVLRDTFESLQISVPSAACVVPPGVREEAEVRLPTSQPGITATDTSEADEVYKEPAPSAKPPANSIGPERTPLATPDPRLASDVIPWWLKLAGLAVLAVLALGVFRMRQRPRAGIDPASDEPDTVQLSTGRDGSVPLPRSGRRDNDFPDPTDLPDGCDGLVVFEGRTGDGQEIRHFSAVNMDEFELLIGRGETDIRIEQDSISRRQARLRCHDGRMTLEDLGSSNGSHVNGVPCLHGEVMYLEPGSQVCFGDVFLSLELVSREESP